MPGRIKRYSTFPPRPSSPSTPRRIFSRPVCVIVALFLTTCMVFLLIIYTTDKEQDQWTGIDQSSNQKRKMGGVLTYEMGVLVWDPSPSEKTMTDGGNSINRHNHSEIQKDHVNKTWN